MVLGKTQENFSAKEFLGQPKSKPVENQKRPGMREPGLSFARLLSSRVRLPAYAFMRTLGQENGSCQTQIFTAVYLFFPLTQIQPLPHSQGKPCAQGVCWV